VELSQAFARLGSSVTLLEAAPEILPLEDGDMAAVVRERLEREGVAVRTSATVARVETVDGTKRVVIAVVQDEGAQAGGGSAVLSTHAGIRHAEEVIEADEILLAVGRTGNTMDLGLSQAGVAVENTFIVADSRLRTSQKHILAVGDVNGRYLFTHVAGAEGSTAVRRIALHAGGAMDYRRVPWCTYSDPELASIGYNEKRAADEGIAFSVITEPFSGNDRARTDNEIEGRIKILVDRSGVVIGTQIVGSHAGDLVAPALFSVGSRWKAGSLMRPMYPYPTFAEIHRRAVSSHMAGRLFNDRVRRVLRFLFRYRGSAGIDPRGDEHGE
jgi:pyruvate/2-oxoglutarate dehydrogenase complex dihydrolipoamide dehydrogenase (E3) component